MTYGPLCAADVDLSRVLLPFRTEKERLYCGIFRSISNHS